MEQLQLSKAFLPHWEGEQKPPCIIHGARVLAYAQHKKIIKIFKNK